MDNGEVNNINRVGMNNRKVNNIKIVELDFKISKRRNKVVDKNAKFLEWLKYNRRPPFVEERHYANEYSNFYNEYFIIEKTVANLVNENNSEFFSSMAFHPSLPLFITGSDGECRYPELWLLNEHGVPVNYNKNNNAAGGGLQTESRFFKLVSINGKEVDGGRYELPFKTKSGKVQTRGPKDKASTAFSEICKKNNMKGECSYKFAIQETTRGSNKKVYHYEGKRVKLAKPIVLELQDKKTGDVKKVVKKYKNIIVSL